MVDKIDRAEFVRRCERDIGTCAVEAAAETRSGYLLNALVWLVKVPKLLALKGQPASSGFEIDIPPLDELRASHMRELPTFVDVSRELGKAYDPCISAKHTFASMEKLSAMNVSRTPMKSTLYETLKTNLNDAMKNANKRIGEQLLDQARGDDMVDAFALAWDGKRKPPMKEVMRTLTDQKANARGKTAEMLVRAFDEVRMQRSEKVMIAASDGYYELRKVHPNEMQGRKVDTVITDDPPHPDRAMQDEMQMWNGKERVRNRAPGYNQADHAAREREMRAMGKALQYPATLNVRLTRQQQLDMVHGHVLKAGEPSGAGWREDTDAV